METRLQQLMRVLRALGAALVFTAAGTFLFQQWEEANQLLRYSGLLAMTVLIPVVAYFCGVRLEEGRSARVFMATLLALVPLHTGVLGGFIFSVFGPDELVHKAAIQWIASSPLEAILVTLGAYTVLTPLVWSAFRILARSHALMLTGVFMAGNVIALAPFRGSISMSICVAAISAIAGLAIRRVPPSTIDTRLVAASLFGPALLTLLRQVFFYDITYAVVAGIAGVFAALVFYFGRRIDGQRLEQLAVAPATYAVGALAVHFDKMVDFSVAEILMFFGLGIGAASLLFATYGERSRRFFLGAAATIAPVCTAGALVVGGDTWIALVAVVLGIVVLSIGFLREERGTAFVGGLLTLGGVGTQVWHAIENWDWLGWPALAVLGALVMVAAAWIERRASIVRARAIREAALMSTGLSRHAPTENGAVSASGTSSATA